MNLQSALEVYLNLSVSNNEIAHKNLIELNIYNFICDFLKDSSTESEVLEVCLRTLIYGLEYFENL